MKTTTNPSIPLRVIDLKQYIYCPRILYYHLVLPSIRPTTYKMEAGIQAHVVAEKRERRRQLKTYGLTAGTRHFNLRLLDEATGLSGELDMVIETDHELIPVDYKMAQRVGPHFKLQLVAYAHLLSKWRDKPINRGFLYLIPKRTVVEVSITKRLQRQLGEALTTIQTIYGAQTMPAPTSKRGRCVDCEFRRFCNAMV